MAVQFIDGFDLYNGVGANTGLQSKWVVSGNSNNNSNAVVAGRFGGQALQMQVNTSAVVNYARSFGAASSGSVGFAMRLSSLAAMSLPVTYMSIAGNPNISLVVTTTGQLQAYRGYQATLLGVTSSPPILISTWQYIEIEWTINNGSGVFNVWVDGTRVLNLTGVNTANSGTTVDTFTVSNGTTATGVTTAIDDVYVTTGAATRLGESRVETLRPNADTATKGWTPNTGTVNFNRVSDVTCDGDTTYVSATAVATADLYGIGAMTTTPAAIFAVQLTGFAYKTDAATRAINLALLSGATASPGANFTLAGGYAKFDRVLETDPNTAAAWTAAAVNGLKIGPTVAL